jgi:hypothetical protein
VFLTNRFDEDANDVAWDYDKRAGIGLALPRPRLEAEVVHLARRQARDRRPALHPTRSGGAGRVH